MTQNVVLPLVLLSIIGLFIPLEFQDDDAPRFPDNRHKKVERTSALRTGSLYLTENIPGTHFCQRLSRPQDHSMAERIISMKNSNATIGNRTNDLPECRFCMAAMFLLYSL